MVQPINYLQNGLPNPTAALTGGINMVAGLDALRQQRTVNTQQNALFQQQQDAQRAAAEAEQQRQQVLGQLAANPTPQNITQVMLRYPDMAENLKRGYDVLDADQQQQRVREASSVYAAIEAGKPDVAIESLRENAVAYRNSGMEKEAKALEDMATMVEKAPESARTSAGLFLASAMGADKFTEAFTGLRSDRREQELQGAKVTEQQAKAQKAAVDAQFAEANAVKDLEKKGWDIYKIQEDVKVARENSRIAAMNAELNRENNDLKRQELQQKIDEAKLKRDEEVRQTATKVEGLRTGIDNSLGVIDRLTQNDQLDNVLGAFEGSAFYPTRLMGFFHGESDARADAVADIETIKSQQFLNNLISMKEQGAAFGGLTEKEGEKLVSYGRSLTRTQSEKQFRENLKKLQQLLMKNRTALAQKYGIPDTIPETPEFQPSPGQVKNWVSQYGGQ